MKRILCIIAAAMMMMPAMMAQRQGEFYVGGNLGIDVGVASATLNIEGEKEKDRDASIPNMFTLAPQFGYFVIDNLEVNANLKYGISSYNQKKSSSGTHEFSVGVGTNYHLRICDRISYAPGLGLDFGLQNIYPSIFRADAASDTGFLFAIGFQLARFDVKVSDHFVLDLDLLGMDYALAHYNLGEGGVKASVTRNGFRFGTGSVGLKYYF